MDNTVDFEFESTVPTDLTISTVSDETVRPKRDKLSTRINDKERREYLREVQLLTNELSKKNAQIKTLQTELSSKTKYLEEKVRECEHQKQINHTKLLTQMRLSEQQTNQQAATINKELDTMKKQIRNWDNMYENLMHSLENFQFSEQGFIKMKVDSQSSQTLDLSKYVMIKIHEIIWKYKKETEELLTTTSNQKDVYARLKEQFSYCKEDLQRTLNENRELHEKVKTLSNQTNAFKSRIEHGNYALENFTRVEDERNKLQEEILNLKKTLDRQNLEVIQLIQEKKNTYEEKIGLQLKCNSLEKENDAICRQVNDLTQKWGESQDILQKLKCELNHEKSSREELLQRFINMRDKLKSEYEERVQLETEKAKSRLVQHYENEIRTLKVQKLSSDQNKETAEVATTELRKKYEELYKRFETNTEVESKELRDLQTELDENKIEHQKLQVNHHKLQDTHKQKCIELEKMSVKLKLTEEELCALRTSSNERLHHLETELGISRARLETFDKMEREVDEVINVAAQDDHMLDEALVSIADQISMPTRARYSFNKCIHLTRKAIQLERLVEQSRELLEQEKGKNLKLAEEMSRVCQLLDQVDQPHSYLISNIRDNENIMKTLRAKLSEAEQHLHILQSERDALLEERNIIASDLEQMLENKEQITKIKQQLTTLQNHHQSKLLQSQKDGKLKSKQPLKKSPKAKWK